jgi:hypothetical protein
MTELAKTIKTGSIVLYIYGSGDSDADMIYSYVGEVGEPACDPKRWLVTFAQTFFNCNENELIWLMDLPTDKRAKDFRETLKEFMPAILAAALRELRHKQLAINTIYDQVSQLRK